MENWKEISYKLVNYFGICNCQRKIRTIILDLHRIKTKCLNSDYSFSGSEWLLLAIMESNDLVTHGINCEYPIINETDPFWVWVDEVISNPSLEDN